ncbi:hypothetical protein BDV23DRAFT_184008 [Aspergillus alliaceus]|uniref:Uncharacterized protein n=1 Tax=Petromyces alliaceus TaxID=209559 RepID=A0A5N7C733_PETAA|nr:hypothetical protein BDV23DRAFT_184008 [Aspergillus alliaceus]
MRTDWLSRPICFGLIKVYPLIPRLRALVQATKLLDDFAVENAVREDVYQLVDAVWQKREELDLDPESQRLLNNKQGFLKNGLTLSLGPDRVAFKEIQVRLRKAQNEFQRSITEEGGGICFTLDETPGCSRGCPVGLTPKNGKLCITFQQIDILPALTYDKNSGAPLGISQSCGLVIEDKMVQKPETVEKFSAILHSQLKDAGQRELDILNQLKKAGEESRSLFSPGPSMLYST